MSTTTPQFDIHAWNQAANSELLSEFQKMTITLSNNREKPKGHPTTAQYLGGVPTSAIIPPMTVRLRPPPTRQQQQRGTSRTVWFALSGAFFAELPAVISASPENRVAAIGTMISKMGLAAAGAGATVLVIKAIEEALQGACEGIVTRATSNLAGYAACGLAGVSVSALVINAFMSFWHLLGASLAQAPKTAEQKMKLFHECWSSDRLVSVSASGVAATLTFTACGMVLAHPVALGVATAILHLTFCVLLERVVEKKKDRGVTWGAWVRGLIVSDERPRMWTTDSGELDLVEEGITDALICPITNHLVVDPVVYIDGPEGQIYERQAIYGYLEKHGKDKVSQAPASALSYKRSAVAARLSAEIARKCGATLELVDDG